jgi:hypothetical protein
LGSIRRIIAHYALAIQASLAMFAVDDSVPCFDMVVVRIAAKPEMASFEHSAGW